MEALAYKIPKEYTTADEINAYNKGFNDGYSNLPFYEYPDFKRFDNLRSAYAIGRREGELKKRGEQDG